MSLIYNTNIQSLIDKHIQGKIARVGGRMNQLMTFKNSKVTDINIIDGGYGKVRNSFNLSSIKTFYDTYKRLLRQELFWFFYGEREMRDRKTVILDMHFAYLDDTLKQKYDATISSNVIEHSPNPIWFMLNFHHITKDNGYQYHAIPNYRYTFDEFREPTALAHLISDFEAMTWFDDTTHNEDYALSAIEKNGRQREFHKVYPISYPYIHTHVFDESNVRELIEYIFQDVTVDCIKTDKIGDNVVIFKNQLNPEFVNKYALHIEKFKAFVAERAKVDQYSKI